MRNVYIIVFHIMPFFKYRPTVAIVRRLRRNENECCLYMHPLLRPALEFRVYAFRRTFDSKWTNFQRLQFSGMCEQDSNLHWIALTFYPLRFMSSYRSRVVVSPLCFPLNISHTTHWLLAQYAKPICAGNLWDSTSELSLCTHLHHRACTLFKPSAQATDLRTSSAAFSHFLPERESYIDRLRRRCVYDSRNFSTLGREAKFPQKDIAKRVTLPLWQAFTTRLYHTQSVFVVKLLSVSFL